MESDEKHSTIQGKYPGCGAIFMSSSSTKDECFRRKLFGLPSLQWPFVKRVKKGMILFLFDFEKKELHGVFQACSDGAMNIVPTAWSRSGKKFPAQVRVYPIWHCHPLPESEFGDAINANYFSKGKFYFGLSKAQVWRLLMLFNLRKLKTPHPQRALARNTAAKLVDHKDIDDELDDGRLSSDKVGNIRKVDNEFGSIIRRRYLEQLPGKVQWDDAKFGNGVNVDLEHKALPSNEHTRSGQNGRVYGNLAMCGRKGSVSGPFYSGMPLQETYSSVQDQKPSSYQMEPITGYSNAASRGDAIIKSILPYDPDDPGMNLAYSQLVGDFDSVQDCEGRNGIPSSYPLSPSNYPSFLVDRRHPVAIQNKPVHKIGPFTANVTSSEEIQCQSPCCSHSADLKSVDYHKCTCSDHKIFDRMLCSDRQENRSSVFSRLRLNTPGWCLENLGHLGHEENVNDTSSVDEIMAMLSESHDSQMVSVKSKLCKRQQGNVGKFRNIKQNSVKSEFEIIPEKSNTTSASPTGDKDDQSSKNTLFLDFKRRSRKVNSDTNGESAGSEGLVVGQCKSRKLIRPNFSENEPRSCEDAGGKKRKLAKSNSSQESSAQCSIGEAAGGKRRKLARPNFRENESSLISWPQCSVGEDAGGSCESFVGSQGKPSLQGAEFSHENEKIDTECFSKYEREIVEGNFGGSPKIGDDSGKECLHAYPVNSCLHVQASVDESSFSEDADLKKKLDGPEFRENELFQVSPHECSSGELAGEIYKALVGSQENIDAQRFTTSEMEIEPESSGESHKIGDESGNPVGSQTAIILPNQLESPQQKGSQNNDWEAPQFGDKDASEYDLREREIEVHLESIVDSVKGGDEYGMESVQVVGTVILGALENSILTRLSEDFPETDQMTVLESKMQPKTNSGTSDGFSEIEGDTGSELEVLPIVELCANINASNRADGSMVNNQQGVNSEQLQASCNSNNHRSPQEDGSKNNLVENMELGVNEAIDDTLRENKKLWSILTTRLQLLRNAKQQ
ncbi:PREDICTED: uncharacterized protein LOC101299944 [Fragaria vesca subsp. vesca]|uniref:uncharacterized protein LOC101299944 n=1 Tax=Fragaria vesca subsp. vesca TaxID=101020 RepID=UPI0002C30F4A|nr:PREDICTED: uncharacterized protein LOC101299944 [Fragaria vesca subsp. vesca]